MIQIDWKQHFIPPCCNPGYGIWYQAVNLIFLGSVGQQLRFFTPERELVPTPEEAEAQERQRAQEAEARAEAERVGVSHRSTCTEV